MKNVFPLIFTIAAFLGQVIMAQECQVADHGVFEMLNSDEFKNEKIYPYNKAKEISKFGAYLKYDYCKFASAAYPNGEQERVSLHEKLYVDITNELAEVTCFKAKTRLKNLTKPSATNNPFEDKRAKETYERDLQVATKLLANCETSVFDGCTDFLNDLRTVNFDEINFYVTDLAIGYQVFLSDYNFENGTVPYTVEYLVDYKTIKTEKGNLTISETDGERFFLLYGAKYIHTETTNVKKGTVYLNPNFAERRNNKFVVNTDNYNTKETLLKLLKKGNEKFKKTKSFIEVVDVDDAEINNATTVKKISVSEENDIANLTEYSNVTTVLGSLVILKNNNLTSLKGLENLSDIQGKLTTTLKDMELVYGKEKAQEELDYKIKANKRLPKIFISQNPKLISLEGLNFENFDCSVSISGNKNLKDFSPLNQLKTYDNTISIKVDNELTMKNYEKALEVMKKEIPFSEKNVLLTKLRKNLKDDIDKEITEELTLNIFENLETVNGDLKIIAPFYTNLNGLKNLKKVTGLFIIQLKNESIFSLEALKEYHAKNKNK